MNSEFEIRLTPQQEEKIEKIITIKMASMGNSKTTFGKTYNDRAYSYKLTNETTEIVRNINVSGFAAKVKETVLNSGWISEKQLDILFQ